MMKRILMLGIVLAWTSLPVSAQDLKDVKCVVNPGADASAEHSAEHMEGTVYFCCGKCAAKFKEDSSDYVATANHQLALTGQFIQTACPISGSEVTEGQSVKIGELEVGMCCGKCVTKVTEAGETAAQIKMVFGKKKFEKSFAKNENENENAHDLTEVMCPMMGEAVSTDFAADYRGGKVYFCCKNCVKKFNKDNEKFAAMANQQLVSTGQFKQKSCPFTGGAVTEGNSVKIGEMEIGMCCGKCKAKVEGADDDKARVAMIFKNESFEKGFEKN